MRRCPDCDHPAAAGDHYCLHCGRPLLGGRGLRTPLLAAITLGAAVLVAAWRATPAAGPSGAPPTVVAAGPVAADPTAAPCRYVLGFRRLHDLLPTRVGDCLDDERYDPAAAVAVQHTRGGLLVWRKAGNVVAFTDGATTWLLGPAGLQSRPNTARLPWEAGAEAPGG